MAKYPGLMRRGTKWYLRVPVPEELQQVIGRKEVWKSLRTGDHGKATSLYFKERARIERQFATARNGPPPIDGEEVRQAVAGWFRTYDNYLSGADFNAHGPGRRGALDDARDDLVTVTHGDDGEVLGPVQAVADEILISLGCPWKHHQIGPVETGQRLGDPCTHSRSRRCTSTLLSWRGSHLRLRSGGYAGTRRVSPAGIPCLARDARGTTPNPAPGPERPSSASRDQRHLRATAGADPSDDGARRASRRLSAGVDR